MEQICILVLSHPGSRLTVHLIRNWSQFIDKVDLPKPSDAQEVVTVVDKVDLPELGVSEVLECDPAQLTAIAEAVDLYSDQIVSL